MQATPGRPRTGRRQHGGVGLTIRFGSARASDGERLPLPVALVIIARPSGAVRQRLTTVVVLASPRWQAWLRHLNRTERCDLFVSVDPLRADACRRTKSEIAEARHVFLDVDGDGDAVLARVHAHPTSPRPLVVVYSSPGRFQALWRAAGATSDDVEATQRGLVAAFTATSPRPTSRGSVGFLGT